MKSHPLRPYVVCILLGALLVPFTAMAESLSEFTSGCETELGIPQNSITGFDCTDGEILPTQQLGTACDAEALLGNGCLENSRLGVKSFSNPDVKGVWVCRKYAGIDDANNSHYHDIAMIIHNRKNGKTCFFQNNLDGISDGPVVPAPKDASTLWKTPQDVVANVTTCTLCHKNDPFIVTPHVAEAFRLNNLIRFNPKGRYSVVGPDFTRFNSEIERVVGCGGLCHFNPSVVTAMVENAVDKHWMPPGHKDAPHWKTPASQDTPEQDTPIGYSPYNFNPINGQFYTLQSSGEIWGFNGSGGGGCDNAFCPHWSVLDANPDTAEIAASGSKLYQRHSTGSILEFTGVQCNNVNSCISGQLIDNNPNPSWQLIDNNSKSAQIVSGGGQLYQMWQTGAIWRYTGTPCKDGNCPGWQLLDNNSATIEIVASGNNLYQRHKSGAVWKYTGTPCSGNSCPGWQQIASDPRTIQLVAGGSSLYMFQQSGAIWKYTGMPCNSTGCPGWQLLDFDNANTKQVAAGSTSLYRLYKNGEVWRYIGPGQNWVLLDKYPNTAEISASFNGLLQRHTAGDVWRFNGPVCSNGSCPGWMQIQSFTNTISITGARQ